MNEDLSGVLAIRPLDNPRTKCYNTTPYDSRKTNLKICSKLGHDR